MSQSDVPIRGTVWCLAGLALVLLARNWAGWNDPLVDFGRELYVPWRLIEGQVLYRDIAYLDGPLSPYWNALCLTLFPLGLRTLEMVNFAIIAGVAALLFDLLRRLTGSDRTGPFSSRVVATVVVAVFLSVFAFNLIGTGGNMNWVTPYSHGITHGVALSVLSVWAFSRHLESGRSRDLALAGMALGLSALTKPEIFAAAAAALAVGMAASIRTPPVHGQPALARVAVLAVAAVIPLFVAVGLLAAAMPLGDAVAGAMGGWSHLLGSDVGNLHFYRWVMGVDDPVENLWQMDLPVGIWGFFTCFGWLASLERARGALRRRILLALLLTLAAAMYLSSFPWGDIFRPVVAFLVAYCVHATLKVWRLPRATSPDDATLAPKAIAALTVSILALVLLGKVFLKPILDGYAFALLVPSLVIIGLVLLHEVPAWIARGGGDGRAFGGVAIVLLAMISVGCLSISEQARKEKIIPIGSDRDQFFAEAKNRARIVKQLTEWVEQKLPRDATLLVLPEGVMVNYLTRRINPTRHLKFLPPELAIFDERKILEDLEASPPDFVALVQRDTLVYGLPLFGTDYGQKLIEWSREEYETVVRVGAEPLRPQRMVDRLNGWEVRGRRADPAGDRRDAD